MANEVSTSSAKAARSRSMRGEACTESAQRSNIAPDSSVLNGHVLSRSAPTTSTASAARSGRNANIFGRNQGGRTSAASPPRSSIPFAGYSDTSDSGEEEEDTWAPVSPPSVHQPAEGAPQLHSSAMQRQQSVTSSTPHTPHLGGYMPPASPVVGELFRQTPTLAVSSPYSLNTTIASMGPPTLTQDTRTSSQAQSTVETSRVEKKRTRAPSPPSNPSQGPKRVKPSNPLSGASVEHASNGESPAKPAPAVPRKLNLGRFKQMMANRSQTPVATPHAQEKDGAEGKILAAHNTELKAPQELTTKGSARTPGNPSHQQQRSEPPKSNADQLGVNRQPEPDSQKIAPAVGAARPPVTTASSPASSGANLKGQAVSSSEKRLANAPKGPTQSKNASELEAKRSAKAPVKQSQRNNPPQAEKKQNPLTNAAVPSSQPKTPQVEKKQFTAGPAVPPQLKKARQPHWGGTSQGFSGHPTAVTKPNIPYGRKQQNSATKTGSAPHVQKDTITAQNALESKNTGQPTKDSAILTKEASHFLDQNSPSSFQSGESQSRTILPGPAPPIAKRGYGTGLAHTADKPMAGRTEGNGSSTGSNTGKAKPDTQMSQTNPHGPKVSVNANVEQSAPASSPNASTTQKVELTAPDAVQEVSRDPRLIGWTRKYPPATATVQSSANLNGTTSSPEPPSSMGVELPKTATEKKLVEESATPPVISMETIAPTKSTEKPITEAKAVAMPPKPIGPITTVNIEKSNIPETARVPETSTGSLQDAQHLPASTGDDRAIIKSVETAPSASAMAMQSLLPSSPFGIPSQVFRYAIFQKLYSEVDDPTGIPARQIPSQIFTDINEANKQAQELIEATKQDSKLYAVQFQSWRETRDAQDCVTFTGSFVNVDKEHAGRKNYHKIWVERQSVSAHEPKVLDKGTHFISKTLYTLRLCKLVEEDEDSSTSPQPEVTLQYVSLSSPPIRGLGIFTELYTVRDDANRAAMKLQIALSHKKEPLKETERKWQELENRKLRDKVHALDGFVVIDEEGSDGEIDTSKAGKGGCWESEFNALDGERYKLWVESTRVFGPRNI